MESYFFIPANHPKLMDKINQFAADQIIIDLEDAVEKDNFNNYLKKLKKIENRSKLYVRPSLFEKDGFNKDILLVLIGIGFTKFMIPKFSSLEDLQKIEQAIENVPFSNFSFILLIENPKSLFQLSNILSGTKLNIKGMVFGSHDYCGETGMTHRLDLLYYPRFTLVSLAKAHGFIAIDIVHTNLNNDNEFLEELENGYDLGFEAKALIHPKQLNLLNEFKTSKKNEYDEALNILNEFESLGKPPVFVFKGKIIEAPHIKFYNNVKNKLEDYGNK